MLWQIGLVIGIALVLFPALRRYVGRAGWWAFGAAILAILVVTAQHYWS